MKQMKFLSDLKQKNLFGKICLLRVDFNVNDADLRACLLASLKLRRSGPARQGLKRGFTRKNIHPRILSVLPTIKFLQKKGAVVAILSHRGRPIPLKRGISKSEFLIFKQFSLKPFAKILSYLLKKPVNFIDFNIGKSDLLNIDDNFGRSDFQKLKGEIKISPAGSIFLLENLRFFPGEDKNDQKFAKNLASLGTFYVNEAFAFSHRPTASMTSIPKFLPSYAGLLLEKEIRNLSRVMKKPKRPLVIILAGAKISDKIGIIKNFLKKAKPRSKLGSTIGADYFLTGGGMANTFIAALNLPIGDSLYEKEMIPIAKQLLNSEKIILPIDLIIKNKKILDIGPKTVKEYTRILKKAKTVIWNGPMGYIENPQFSKGTKAIAKAILKSYAFSIVGGGETTSISYNSKLKTQNSKLFLSTGGGAMLEYLAGKKLPGIQALHQRQSFDKLRIDAK